MYGSGLRMSVSIVAISNYLICADATKRIPKFDRLSPKIADRETYAESESERFVVRRVELRRGLAEKRRYRASFHREYGEQQGLPEQSGDVGYVPRCRNEEWFCSVRIPYDPLRRAISI